MALKERTCRYCKARFVPPARHPGVRFCSEGCGVALAEKMRAKAERANASAARKEVRQRLESMKGIPELTREAQAACNAYIRARDNGKPCISCGTPLSNEGHGGGFDAGHYRSRGAAPHLRFHEDNIHGQCKRCNRYLAGNVSAMRIGLIERIGKERVEAIEADNSTHKWTRDELMAIKRHYTAKLKEAR